MKKFLLITMSVFTGVTYSQYNFYFGNLHSHSSYSDGNKDSVATGYYTPADNFRYAKSSYHIDFWGVSEHNHFSSTNNPGMRVADYAKGLYQADTSNVNGTFVSLFGFEWGVISGGGHLVTYGVPDLVGWESLTNPPGNNYNRFCAKNDYASFWPIVNAYPNGFCTLAHPSSGDYGDLLGSATAWNAAAEAAIVGTAIRSGNAFSQTSDYTDPPPTGYESSYLRALAKGYHLGPVMDHDNHYTTFGRTNQTRTVVLATVLHRDSILSAYKAGRFYASDDWNTKVTFTVNGNYMGSDFATGANSSIYVAVADEDAGDVVSNIQLYFGVPGSGTNATVLTSAAAATLNFVHTTSLNNKFCYFAKITQADGNIIWTSPIWVFRNAVTLPVELTSFTGRYEQGSALLNWTAAIELNNDYFTVERSTDGSNFAAIGSVPGRSQNSRVPADYAFTDNQPFKGLNFYRLKQVDKDGNFSYSAIVVVDASLPFVQDLRVSPNPVSSVLTAGFTARQTEILVVRIYTAEGREVLADRYTCGSGYNRLQLPADRLPPGSYILVLSRPNARLAEARFIKQ